MDAPESDLTALRAALATLIDTWEADGRSAEEEARKRRITDVMNARFYQGAGQVYMATADALRRLLESSALESAAPDMLPAPEFIFIEEAEVMAGMERVGLRPRTLHRHPDQAFTAVFPRLQAMAQEDRAQKVASADARIVILNAGKLPDSGEPYIDFGFRAV